MTMRHLAVLIVLFACLPACAQGLSYNNGTAAAQKEALPTIVKKARGNEKNERPDWFGLFHIWTKDNATITLSGLRDPASFENLVQFYACDYTRDFRHNDVVWAQRQTAIVQKFNTLALNPQRRFRLLARGVLGPYDQSTQTFVFEPLKGAAYSFAFPTDKNFGIEDDCRINAAQPQDPWPAQFVITFGNPDFIGTLPMSATKAAAFLDALPKDNKGEIDRHIVIEIEMEITDFAPLRPDDEAIRAKKPLIIETHAAARRAVVYADAEHLHPIWRYGFTMQLPQ